MIAKEIDFRLEAIFLMEKMVEKKDIDQETIQRFLAYGFDNEEMKQLFSNYMTFKEKVLQDVPKCQDAMMIYFQPFLQFQSIMGSFYINYKLYDDLSFVEVVDKFYQDLFEDALDVIIEAIDCNKVIACIADLDVDNQVKWMLTYFYTHAEAIWEQVMPQIDLAAKVIKKHFVLIENDITTFYASLLNHNQLRDEFNKVLNTEYFKDDAYLLTMTVFSYNQLRLMSRDDNGVKAVYLGYMLLLMRDIKASHTLEDAKIQSALKVLSDATRFKIVKILMDKMMYVQEMASHLSLTSATLVHHLEILLSEGMIEIHLKEDEKKKIYYTTNKLALKAFIKKLEGNLWHEEISDL